MEEEKDRKLDRIMSIALIAFLFAATLLTIAIGILGIYRMFWQ